MAHRVERREFLTQAAVATGAVLGGFQASAKGYRANETINIGCIGTGGRAQLLMSVLKKIPGAQIVAVCDVWDDNLARAREIAGHEAFATKHHEELLAREGIDAVLIGSPDHLHVPLSIDACHAGKDVYVEKPLTHSIAEGQRIIDVVLETKRVMQVGMQQRSMPHLIEAKQIIESGALGKIRKVHLTWNRNAGVVPKPTLQMDASTVDWKRFLGPAPDQPFNPVRFRNWRPFWDFGGGIFTDLMVHFVDVAHFFLGLDHPDRATSIGNMFTFFDYWEAPDTVQTLLQYTQPHELQIYFEGTFYNARNHAMMEYMGSEATLYCDRGQYRILPEAGSRVEAKELVLGHGGQGDDFYNQPDGELLHLGNWLECIRTRATPNAPVQAGVGAANAAHLANAALRKDAVVRWGEA